MKSYEALVKDNEHLRIQLESLRARINDFSQEHYIDIHFLEKAPASLEGFVKEKMAAKLGVKLWKAGFLKEAVCDNMTSYQREITLTISCLRPI